MYIVKQGKQVITKTKTWVEAANIVRGNKDLSIWFEAPAR